MNIWQADFYKDSSTQESQPILWHLLICDSQGNIIHEANCPQSQANSDWLVSEIKPLIKQDSPPIIQVFRPQSLGLLTTAAEKLGIKVEATRRTSALKQALKKRAIEPNYNPVKLEQLPPQALPENLWGDQWRFATIAAGELIDFFSDRPIPIIDMPELLLPINLGITLSLSIPGIVIYGGKKSMILARWLADIKPVALNYIPTTINQSGGLVLEAGLVERWIVATFEDSEIAQVAQSHENRKQESKGLHFLCVQPDDSGITYSGFWLLRNEEN